MLRQSILHVLAIAPLFGFAFAQTARADEPLKVSGPHTHENLSIFFVHGKSADGPVPLTLEEALAKGFVEVHETDTVSRLVVENTGKEEVFVHAGDIVKGGRQDRVVTASFIIPAKSKKIEMPVYCVEAGRWAPRGAEDSRKFATSAEMLPTKEAKFAMMAAPAADGSASAGLNITNPRTIQLHSIDREQRTYNAEPQQRAGAASNGNESFTESGPAGGQSEVWRNVAAIQEKLSAKLKTKVASETSQSSLQLALENKDLAAEQERYVKALQGAGESEADIVGYAIAVNGKIASADVYPSNALFKKLWPRLLKTAVTEAIGADEIKDAKAPAATDVELFLARAPDAKEETASPVAGFATTARAEAASYDTETTRGGKFLHRSKVAR